MTTDKKGNPCFADRSNFTTLLIRLAFSSV